MKRSKLLALFFLLLSAVASAQELPTVHVTSPSAGIDITTQKVVRIQGSIMPGAELDFVTSIVAVNPTPGEDLVIVIASTGGDVIVGGRMIELVEILKRAHIRTICVADKQASSMAFNLMSHCDVRLATPGSHMKVHKIRIFFDSHEETYTARQLRDIAKHLDEEDRPFQELNQKLMHLTPKDYNLFANQETIWRAEKLLSIGYLHGLAKIE